MTALWILLAALLVVLLAGLGCFALACARRPQPDMADPAVLKQSKYAPLADEILSGYEAGDVDAVAEEVVDYRVDLTL